VYTEHRSSLPAALDVESAVWIGLLEREQSVSAVAFPLSVLCCAVWPLSGGCFFHDTEENYV
ncbi:MAG: hypothetical protein LIO42_06210, partial [Oscillospiraceae bacterium]|nr:hypothetical protein [Oscillospiraceae bacterium]